MLRFYFIYWRVHQWMSQKGVTPFWQAAIFWIAVNVIINIFYFFWK